MYLSLNTVRQMDRHDSRMQLTMLTKGHFFEMKHRIPGSFGLSVTYVLGNACG